MLLCSPPLDTFGWGSFLVLSFFLFRLEDSLGLANGCTCFENKQIPSEANSSFKKHQQKKQKSYLSTGS